MKDAKIIALVGPTASGKTSLAIELAKKLNGEVISVDSRQIYRGLDIGTEKATEKEMDGIPHHMIDIVEPEQTFTVQEFQTQARNHVEDILSRGKIPILAGGSGQYMDAVLYDTNFPIVPPNEKLREDLEALPTTALFKVLKDQDPDRAENIDPHNKRRLVRALEIVEALGKVPPQEKGELLYNTLYFGIEVDKEDLRGRIEKRLSETLKKGLVDEVQNLRKRVDDARLDEFGLEYRVIRHHLDANLSEEELKESLLMELIGYAKRQMTWFKKNKDIIWKKKEDVLLAVEKLL
jgi:tRNA dimethylallyltransferase